MSGGSYDYLYQITLDGGIGHAGRYREMADDHTIAEYPDVQAALRKLADEREALNAKHNALRDLMHAIEWVRSCDWGPDQLDEVITEWRKKVANGG